MKKAATAITLVIFFLIMIFTPAVSCAKTRGGEDFPIKTETPKVILTLWNVDTFEGGYGSRTDYLSRICDRLTDKGIFVIVSSYGLESAEKKINGGVLPDIISFGVGADFVLANAQPLAKSDFVGGEALGRTYAEPWCRGGYFLISENPVNEHIDRLIVSKGNYNNPLCALHYSPYEAKETVVLDPLSAYVEYLKGGAVLLGTQRDVRRLTVKNKPFTAVPLEEFCDLYQYIAITSANAEKIPYAKSALKFIVENSDKNVSEIGMLPIGKNAQSDALGAYDTLKTDKTLSPFTMRKTLEELFEALEGGNAEEKSVKLENTIKHL